MSKALRVIISGGGTGGHIFPAVSIANAIKALRPDADILFVGAEGRMEMQRVPAAGYEIKGLPIRGFFRPLWKPANIGVAIDYLKSKWMAKKILREFRPDVAVGVGGYASSAALGAANSLGIPTLIQEQNSYAGLANKTLAAKASKICVAYDGMERFFPADKIILTGNPVRQNLLDTTISHDEAVKSLGFDPKKKPVERCCRSQLIQGGIVIILMRSRNVVLQLRLKALFLIPIVHHLCHTRSHATCHTSFSIFLRYLLVIGVALIPLRLQ